MERKSSVSVSELNHQKFCDAAIGGRGGCPMATDHLTGNLAMENLVEFFQKETKIEINNNALNEAVDLSAKVFNTYF